MVMKETVDKANASATQEARSSVLKLSPEGEREKREKKGKWISKVLIIPRFTKITKTKLQPFLHDTYAGVFARPQGG